MRRKHMERFIETLYYRDMSKQLTLFRLIDADDMKETLRANQCMAIRANKATMGSNKFRPRSGFSSYVTTYKSTRAVREIRAE